MNKNTGNGKRNFNNNNKGGFNKKSKEEYEARKAEQIARQTKNLDVIEEICAYLNDWLGCEKTSDHRISMKEILDHLNNKKGFTADETKAVSQYSYLLMELANAQDNKYISGDRTNIRIMYIEERFKTSFKKELHERAVGIVDKYTILFAWDEKANADNYNVLGDKDNESK